MNQELQCEPNQQKEKYLGKEDDFPNKNFKYQIEYQYLPHSNYKQEGKCYAITINSKGELAAAGCDDKIKIYEVHLGKLKLLQQIDNGDNVYCLQFIKNQNTFVSGDFEKQIKIWIQLKGSWSLNIILQGHTSWITCLAINSKGDQIISGTQDSIRIWSLESKVWSNCQAIRYHKDRVYSMSLNESEDQLVSCDGNGLVLVMALGSGKQWSVVQQLKLQIGYRICFISNKQFSFQPAKSQQLLIFSFDKNQNQFVQTKVVQMTDENKYIECSWFFPQQFIKEKTILVNKFKNHLNIVRRLESGEFQVDQSILMNSNVFYGTMSNNGEYLFLKEQQSSEITVYKSKEIRITQQLL